jgi:hypothetical protein
MGCVIFVAEGISNGLIRLGGLLEVYSSGYGR